MAADSPKRRLTLKKILYHPLAWVAVGAHILLLVVPFDSSSSEAIEDTSEQPEELESIPVDILNLSEIATSEPPPPNPPASLPPSAPAPASAIAPQPAPLPVDTTSSDVDPGQEGQLEAQVSADLSSAQQTTSEQLSAYDASGDQRQFIQNLDGLGLGGYTNANGERSLPGANSFRKNVDPSYFITETGTRPNTVVSPVAGARDARWLDKEPANALTDLQATYSTVGVSFTQLEDYGGEPLYELTTANGDAFMHISLVKLIGSTLLVVWQADPRVQ